MKHNKTLLICMTALAAWSAAAQDTPVLPKVKVYLPREIKAEGKTITLGQICIIHCDDMDLATKAQGIAMGRSAQSREAIVLDRQTILCRLASEGIPAGRVEFSGADKLSLTRDETLLAADRLVATAETLLHDNPPQGAAKWTLVRTPQAMAAKLKGEPVLKARVVSGAPAGHVRVDVLVFDGDKLVDSVQLLYRLQFAVRQAMATKDIPAGDIITPDNVQIKSTLAERPLDNELPYGRQATAKIQAGATVTPAMLKAVKAALSVKRDQTVVMRISGAAFTVTAMGQALEDGQAGQFIKVRNVDSKRVLMAKVCADGSVEPVMQDTPAAEKAAVESETAPIAAPIPASQPASRTEVRK